MSKVIGTLDHDLILYEGGQFMVGDKVLSGLSTLRPLYGTPTVVAPAIGAIAVWGATVYLYPDGTWKDTVHKTGTWALV